MMGLEAEQLTTLKRPFPRADHEFIRNFVYLTEEAITTRIEEVDPSWEFAVLNLTQVGNQAVAHARMTICGVFRDGVGMQVVNEKAGEAEKGAATDALKRCARLFGVGRYLLDAPPQAEFDRWLAERQKEAGINAPQGAQNGVKSQQRAQQPPPAPSTPAGGVGSSAPKAGSPSSIATSQPSGDGSAKDEFFPDDDTSPIKRYVCTQVRVVPFGNGKQVQLKRADGEGVIVLLGREKLLNAAYPEAEVSEWIGTTNKWFRLMPEAEVEAAFDGTKWDVGQIRMLEMAAGK